MCVCVCVCVCLCACVCVCVIESNIYIYIYIYIYIRFNDINYIQTLGTLVGTKMAPTYATLTLPCSEGNLY